MKLNYLFIPLAVIFYLTFFSNRIYAEDIVKADNTVKLAEESDSLLDVPEIPKIEKLGEGMDGEDIKTTKINPGKLILKKEALFKTNKGTLFANIEKDLSIVNGVDVAFSLKKIYGEPVSANTSERCIYCHKGIEVISKNHDFKCQKCHIGNVRSKDKIIAHKGMVKNPSSLKNSPKFCGKCHEEIIANITRYQWQAQGSYENFFAILKTDSFEKLPESKKSDLLVDRFLEEKCLKCHLDAPASNRFGEYRAKGCSGCHMIYANDGVSRSSDVAIRSVQKNKRRGYPLRHTFTVSVPTLQCVRCHSGNRVGTEYIGLFESDDRLEFSSELSKKGNKNFIYGKSHIPLIPDIHFESGLHCVDCHTFTNKHLPTTIKCTDCHGTFTRPPSTSYMFDADYELKAAEINPNYKIKVGDSVLKTEDDTKLAHIKINNNEYIMTSKVTGKEFNIPILSYLRKNPVSHRIKEHREKVSCSLCHSSWVSNNFGFNIVIKEKDILNLNDDEEKKGLVFNEYFSMKRWEGLIGMINPEGKFSASRPVYQWNLTTDEKNIKIKEELIFNPYTPHTQRKKARVCEDCHQNRYFVGLGSDIFEKGFDRTVKIKGEPDRITTKDMARFLSEEERIKLLSKSKRYRYYRYLDLKERGLFKDLN